MAGDNLVLASLMRIENNVGSINEHLKTLNSKVVKQECRIQELEESDQKNKILFAKIGVIASMVSFVVTIVITLGIKFFL